MSYTYKDNTDEVLAALKMAKKRGLEAIGLVAEGHAKKKRLLTLADCEILSATQRMTKQPILEQMSNMPHMLSLEREAAQAFIC